MTDSSDKPGNSRAAGTSSIVSEDEVASRTPHETVRRSLNESTRFDAGPVVAALDAQMMRASIGTRLFGVRAEPVRLGR